MVIKYEKVGEKEYISLQTIGDIIYASTKLSEEEFVNLTLEHRQIRRKVKDSDETQYIEMINEYIRELQEISVGHQIKLMQGLGITEEQIKVSESYHEGQNRAQEIMMMQQQS